MNLWFLIVQINKKGIRRMSNSGKKLSLKNVDTLFWKMKSLSSLVLCFHLDRNVNMNKKFIKYSIQRREENT